MTGTVGPPAVLLLAAGVAAAGVSTVQARILRGPRWPTWVRRQPHQVGLIGRCLVEAACLRTARRLLGGQAGAVVVLSASEALHGAAAVLGGLAHLRFVHEVTTTEDLPVRLLRRPFSPGQARVLALCPTAAVQRQLARAFPRLPATVRAFAVDDGARLTEAERDRARAALEIPAGDPVVCLVGGWWQHKDIATVDTALARLRHPLQLLVVGAPLDQAVLRRWQALPRCRLHVLPGPVGGQLLRGVYAVADAALVARHRGVGKESGLVMDTARYGVGLIVSDHDPVLTSRLAGQDWVRLFPAGDPQALAELLDRLAIGPLPPRPGPHTPRLLGMPTAAEQAAFFVNAYTRLAVRPDRCRPR